MSWATAIWAYVGVAVVLTLAFWTWLGYMQGTEDDPMEPEEALIAGIAGAAVALLWLPAITLGLAWVLLTLPFTIGRALGKRHDRRARLKAEKRATEIEALRTLRSTLDPDSEAWRHIDMMVTMMIKDPEYTP